MIDEPIISTSRKFYPFSTTSEYASIAVLEEAKTTDTTEQRTEQVVAPMRSACQPTTET